MCAITCGLLDDVVREALTLGADHQGPFGVAGGASATQRVAPRSGDERDAPARQPRRSSVARASGTAKIAPMLARTAFGLNGSAVPGPIATDDGAERLGGAQDRADVAGIVDAVQVDAQRAGRLRRPPLLVDRERPRPGRQPRRLREQLRLDLDALQAAAGRAVALDRLPAGGVGGGEQVLALGDEPAGLARARAGASGACGSP